MSTHAIIKFCNSEREVEAVLYQHADGYPDTDSGVIAQFDKFLDRVTSDTADTRFDCPEYLSAKYLVWYADYITNLKARCQKRKPKLLDFNGISPITPALARRMGAGTYTYRVLCAGSGGRPVIAVEEKRATSKRTGSW